MPNDLTKAMSSKQAEEAAEAVVKAEVKAEAGAVAVAKTVVKAAEDMATEAEAINTVLDSYNGCFDLTLKDTSTKLVVAITTLSKELTWARFVYQKITASETLNSRVGVPTEEADARLLSNQLSKAGWTATLIEKLSGFLQNTINPNNPQNLLRTFSDSILQWLPKAATPFQTFSSAYTDFSNNLATKLSEICTAPPPEIPDEISSPQDAQQIAQSITKYCKGILVEQQNLEKWIKSEFNRLQGLLSAWYKQKYIITVCDKLKEGFYLNVFTADNLLSPTISSLRKKINTRLVEIKTNWIIQLKKLRGENLKTIALNTMRLKNNVYENFPGFEEFVKDYISKKVPLKKFAGVMYITLVRKYKDFFDLYRDIQPHLKPYHERFKELNLKTPNLSDLEKLLKDYTALFEIVKQHDLAEEYEAMIRKLKKLDDEALKSLGITTPDQKEDIFKDTDRRKKSLGGLWNDIGKLLSDYIGFLKYLQKKCFIYRTLKNTIITNLGPININTEGNQTVPSSLTS